MFEVFLPPVFEYGFDTAARQQRRHQLLRCDVGERTFQPVTPQFRDNRVVRIDIAIGDMLVCPVVVPQFQVRPVGKVVHVISHCPPQCRNGGFPVFIHPVPYDLAHYVLRGFPFAVVGIHSEYALHLQSVLYHNNREIASAVGFSAKRIFELQACVTLRAMATLRLCLVPLVAAIEAGRPSARRPKGEVFDGMPECPFLLPFRDRQQPLVGGYYLVLKSCPCFHTQKSKREGSGWLVCVLAAGLGLLWRCCILRISSS